jgi:hypothetical protein
VAKKTVQKPWPPKPPPLQKTPPWKKHPTSGL